MQWWRESTKAKRTHFHNLQLQNPKASKNWQQPLTQTDIVLFMIYIYCTQWSLFIVLNIIECRNSQVFTDRMLPQISQTVD